MALVGALIPIVRLSRAEWSAYIDRNPALVRPQPRQLVNPFTGHQEVHVPDSGEAEILAAETVVGAIEPSPEFEDDGELHVYAADGKHEFVKTAARDIAGALNATFEWFAD